MQNELLLVKQY